MSQILNRRFRIASRLGPQKLHKVSAADLFEDEVEEGLEIEDEEAEMKELTASEMDRGMPLWICYARVAPKRYWTRPLLGGDETAMSVFSFFTNIVHLHGTVIKRCLLPASLSALMTGIVMVVQGLYKERSTERMLSFEFFLPYLLIVEFVLGFRLFGAWHSYRRGHAHVVQMASSAVDLLLTVTTNIHVCNSGMDRLEMIRRINILFAFIRQDLRESRNHLVDTMTFKAGHKKGTLANEWFNSKPDKFVQDRFGAPPLKLLLKQGEINVYKNYSPQDRVTICTIVIRTLFAKYVNLGEKKMSTPDSKIFQDNLENIVHCWGKCREIVRTPPPFVLHHLALMLTFSVAFLFGPLFLATNVEGGFPILASFALTCALYALEEAACEMEVPFGWRPSDANLSKLCRTVLKRSRTFVQICKIKPTEPLEINPQKLEEENKNEEQQVSDTDTFHTVLLPKTDTSPAPAPKSQTLGQQEAENYQQLPANVYYAEQPDAAAYEQHDADDDEGHDTDANEQHDAAAYEQRDADTNEQHDADTNEQHDADAYEQHDADAYKQHDADAYEQHDANVYDEQHHHHYG